MAITVVQSATNNALSGVTSLSVTLTSPAAGNCLLVGIGFTGGTATAVSSVTDDQSQTYTQAQVGVNFAGARLDSWIISNNSLAGSVVTVNFNGTCGCRAVVLEISGQNTTTALDTALQDFGSISALSPFSDSFTVAAANELIVAFWTDNNGASDASISTTGFGNAPVVSNSLLMADYNTPSGTVQGSNIITATTTHTGNFQWILIAIAVGSTGPTVDQLLPAFVNDDDQIPTPLGLGTFQDDSETNTINFIILPPIILDIDIVGGSDTDYN